MEEKKGYNVLKLVMQGNRCYVSTDYVRGKPLIYWLKYHPDIPKEQLFGWIRDVLRDLECFHQSQGSPAYQYVNPYSMIISEELKIYLLDPGGKGHEELLHMMQRKMVREHFLSPDNQFYQKAGIGEDVYGFGKSLQYLIASVEAVPPLSMREERKLRKIISKCLNQKSKRSYKTIREISLHFPKAKDSKKRIGKDKDILKNILYLISLCLLIGMNSYLVMQLDSKREEIERIQNTPKIIETKVKVVEKELEGEIREKLLETALIHMLDYKEYEKSKETLRILEEDLLAAHLLRFVDYLQNKNMTEEQLEELLMKIDADATEIMFWNEMEYSQILRKKAKQLQLESENVIKEEDIWVEN